MAILKTKNKAKELASKCKSRTDFFKKYQIWYNFSRENGWLDEFFGEIIPKYSVKENVIIEAKKYKSLKEFHDKSGNAWRSAKKNGWIDEMFWFKNKNEILKQRRYYVYKIEICELNSIYIGITCQKKGKRWNEHNSTINKKNNKYDTVKQFCIDNNIELPNEIILKEDLCCKDAQYYEKYYVDFFKKHNWNVLNKGKCGVGVSAIGNAYKWDTKEKIINEGKKYKTREEFKKKCPGAFSSAKKHNLFAEIFGGGEGLTYFSWKNKNNVINEGKKYKSRTDFFKHNIGAYNAACKNKWIDEIFPLDKETIRREALKYKDRYEFRKNNLPFFKKASEKKWLDEWFPFSLKFFNEMSMQYKSASEFKKKNYFYYNQAKKYGFLKNIKYSS